jgi:hypothetical protein
LNFIDGFGLAFTRSTEFKVGFRSFKPVLSNLKGKRDYWPFKVFEVTEGWSVSCCGVVCMFKLELKGLSGYI